jgi:hypothetical protein
MSSSARFVTLCVACNLLGLAGASCKAHAEDHAQTASATTRVSASAESAPAASATPAAKPWFAGAFQGNYEAKLAPVEVKTGAVRDWAADDGKLSSGPGKLELKINDDGLVDGSSEGALGASTASGKVEDDTLRVVLAPNDTSGLHGVLVATRAGDGFRGAIEASSGDSLRVRQAPVELKKQAD